MTDEQTQINAEMAFKSKRNFEDFMSSIEKSEIDEVLTNYPHNTVVVNICDLTQNIEAYSMQSTNSATSPHTLCGRWLMKKKTF